MRIKPTYSYTFCKDAPLKEQRHSHRMKGKGTRSRGATRPPTSLPKGSAGFKRETSYGSHRAYELLVAAVRKEIGYVI